IKKGVNPEMFWTGYLTSKGKADEEPDDVDEIDEHGDETQYGNLLRHLDIGKHKIRPEKITLHDCALQLYKQKLEGIQAHNNTLKEVSEAMIELANGVDKCNEGWALRGKNKHVKYSTKAKNFANKMFRLGDGSGRKMDPAEVERLMKENDQIKPFERMNAQQIRQVCFSFFVSGEYYLEFCEYIRDHTSALFARSKQKSEGEKLIKRWRRRKIGKI
ncbi:hypothetical protein PENTCL1PPCAC_19123, partial [Pristionchus entomophagus]